jgi:hypothetical protein
VQTPLLEKCSAKEKEIGKERILRNLRYVKNNSLLGYFAV